MSISRRSFLQGAALQMQRSRPNVLVLYADDMSYRTIRSLNNPEIKTPNLDKLVSRGTAFTHAFIMGGLQPAVCVPSRAMLMSGQNLFHATANVVRQSEWGPPKDFHLWPEILGRSGYQTIGIGKWHNGPELFHRAFQKGGPILFGGMADHYRTPIHDFNPAGKYPKDAAKPRAAHSSEIFADAAIQHIQERDKSKPFALYCAFTAPHDPRQPPKEFKAMYPEERIELPPNFLPQHPFDNGELKVRDEALLPWPRTPEAIRKERSDYYALITHLDAQVGRILDALDREGLARSTIVVFAGDNGLAVGQHGLLGKQSLYDHSIRVPLIMAGPGIRAGQRTETMVYLFDIFPTLFELIGLPVPPTVDGKSMMPVLKDPKHKLRDGMVFAYRHYQRALRTTRWKYIRYNVDGVQTKQLFDIAADPWERKDVSKEPANEETCTQLDILMKMLLKQSGDPA
ncbi:MAG: sulfatase-like hydrolase/transferase [Acidobacteria bacterium]|nr:sulfatase-like hydrolase/transferase [Acidobacteriota bacterium]